MSEGDGRLGHSLTPSITQIEWDKTYQWRINNSAGHTRKTSDINMSGDGSLGYRSQETSHYYFNNFNDGGIYDYESLGVSEGDGRLGYWFLESSYSSSRNCGIYHIGDQSGENGIWVYRRPGTIPLAIMEQELMLMLMLILMLMEEVDICIIPENLPTITQVAILDCWFFILLSSYR